MAPRSLRLPVTDTVKTVDAQDMVTATLDRAHLRTVQTPQAFAYGALLDAHRRAASAGRDDFSDDAALAEWAGLRVAVFAGEKGNVKMTTAEDFSRAEARARRKPRRCAHRHRLRHSCLRGRRPHLAWRRPHPARQASSPAIRTRTWRCTRWSTRSSARWPTATSACISRRAMRNGAAPPPTGSWPSRSSA